MIRLEPEFRVSSRNRQGPRTSVPKQVKQSFSGDFRKGQSSSPSSSASSEPSSPKAPFVVKPPEKKHRLPSAYNRFMKEEIQRIKTANPEIPHREAFSAAAKNWARNIPNSPAASQVSGSSSNPIFAGMK